MVMATVIMTYRKGPGPERERNLIATRTVLAQAGIPIVAEEVGGGHGRSVYFRVDSGAVEVRSMAKGNVVI